MILKRRKRIELSIINKKIDDKNSGKYFFMFVMGMLICGISVNLFLEPYDVSTIGGTGIAILISKYLNINLSLVIFTISSIMLVLSFMVFGVKYGKKMILGTIFYPIFIRATSLFSSFISFDNPSLLLLIISGSVLMGFGLGIIKRSGFGLGMLDFIYDLIYLKFKISIDKASLIFNFLIVIFSLFVFGTNKCIYTTIGIYISLVIMNKITLGISRNKAFYIVTKRPFEVKDYIINNLNHTVTIVNARGGYSDKKKKLLLCVIPTIEYLRVKEVVREIDKDAFFLITDSYYVSK